ncbi:MAG: hypothetical protein RTU63_12055 [Candidatus Thorarchaeota archaeon]
MTSVVHKLMFNYASEILLRPMETDEMKWLLKGKMVCDFRGFPLGRVKKVWYDETDGPLVIVEKEADLEAKLNSWEAIPLRAVDSVSEHVRLKPPTFAE